MATYFFETITAAQALGFTAASDTLVFGNPTSSGAKTSVTFNAATATQGATETVTDLVTGRSVVFGTGFAGEGDTATLTGTVVFQDGSNLYVGTTTTLDDTPTASTNFGDALFGGDGNDTLNGGNGNDVIQGNAGNDSYVPATRDRSDPSYQRPLTIDRSRFTG